MSRFTLAAHRSIEERTGAVLLAEGFSAADERRIRVLGAPQAVGEAKRMLGQLFPEYAETMEAVQRASTVAKEPVEVSSHIFQFRINLTSSK